MQNLKKEPLEALFLWYNKINDGRADVSCPRDKKMKNLKSKIILAIIFLAFASGTFGVGEYFMADEAQAAGNTYYVSTDGNDSNNGSVDLPFATPQKGVDTAMPGDTVILKPGVYYGSVNFPRSGESGRPIILEGQPGAIINSGVIADNWIPAPEVGQGVYKTTVNMPGTPTPAKAYHLTWNKKMVLHISDANMATGASGWNRLKDPQSSSNWSGVVALYGRSGNTTYLRHKDMLDPNKAEIRVGPHWEYDQAATAKIIGKSNIIVKGLEIRGNTVGVRVARGSSDNIIEGNTIIGGKYGVSIDTVYTYVPDEGSGISIGPLLCHRNIVRNNSITLDYIYDIKRGEMGYTLRQFVWDQFKTFSDNDREAVWLDYAGHDNVVYNNHIFKHWGGVQDSTGWKPTTFPKSDFNQRFKVSKNTIHDILDDALEPTGGEKYAEWDDNLVYDSNVAFRLKTGSNGVGPMYVYNNKFYGENSSTDLFMFGETGAEAYFYHNSFASRTGIKMPSATTGKFQNTWFVNNIFSNALFWQPILSGDTFDPHFDYNLAVSPDSLSARWLGLNVKVSSNRVWGNPPDFKLPANNPAIDAGIDLSKNWVIDGLTKPALPSMAAGYFSGTAPDLGAYEYIDGISDIIAPALPVGFSVR